MRLQYSASRTNPIERDLSTRKIGAAFGTLVLSAFCAIGCSGQGAAAQPPVSAAKGGEAAVKAFVAANQASLQMDAMQGYGGTLATLAHVAGCMDLHELSMSLRRSHGRLFQNDSPSAERLGERLVDHMRNRPEFVCRGVGPLSRLSSAGQWRPKTGTGNWQTAIPTTPPYTSGLAVRSF